MAGDEIMAIVAIVLIFGTPLLITFSIVTTVLLSNLLKQRERENARQAYRELLSEKTDVLKTAMLIGYSHDEIRDLDQRLERLVGEEKLRAVLLGDETRLKDLEASERGTDLEYELALINKSREARNA